MPLSRSDTDTLRKLLHAAGILNVYGLLADGERRLVHARMVKWKAKREGSKPIKRRAGRV